MKVGDLVKMGTLKSAYHGVVTEVDGYRIWWHCFEDGKHIWSHSTNLEVINESR